MSEDKEEPYCSDCNGNDVLIDAWGVWNIDTQEWDLDNTFDDGYCKDCDKV